MQRNIYHEVRAELQRAEQAYRQAQSRMLAKGLDPKARRQALAPYERAYQMADANFVAVRRVALRAAVEEMLAQRDA